MPFANTTANDWAALVTTTTDTVVQNRDSRPVWVSTEDTTSSDLDEGVELQPGDAIVIAAGNDVEVSSIDAVARVFYMDIGEPAP